MALAHIGVINNDHGRDAADLNLIHLFNTLILDQSFDKTRKKMTENLW